MNLFISFLSTDISVAFALSMLVLAMLVVAFIMQLMQHEYEQTIQSMRLELEAQHHKVNPLDESVPAIDYLSEQDKLELSSFQL